jgi:Mor family transcriptional regulator
MSAKNDDSYVELQYQFTDIARAELGFDEQVAGTIAEALIRGLSKRMRGQSIYIPSAPYISERNAAIRKENNGRNRDELCSKYDISLKTFYKIINEKG